MDEIINAIKESNQALGFQVVANSISQSNNDNERGNQVVNQVENQVEIQVENRIENQVENDCFALDEKDEAKKKFYQLLYANEDFKKKLRENKSILKRKKEHLELINEIKIAYSKLSKDRSRS